MVVGEMVFSRKWCAAQAVFAMIFARGTLNTTKDGISGTAATTSDWDYDGLGNWSGVDVDGTTTSRTANAQNEITGIGGAMTPTYDANGNLTGDETGRQFLYDAWNRLVTVKDSSGTVLESLTYDGLNRRVTNTASGTTTSLYYSSQWQVLEERVSGATTNRYVWSPVYVDAMVLRDRDTNGDGTLDERLWVQQDANWNVTALVDGSGDVVERHVYDPYGAVTVLTPSFGSRSSSSYDWNQGFQGFFQDQVTKWLESDSRWYSPTLGTWTSLDPIGFAGGNVDLYGFVGNNPLNWTDPSGLAGIGHHWVPVSVAVSDDILPYLTEGALFEQAGYTSGATFPKHNYGWYGDVHHSEYNQLVKKELLAFMEEKGVIKVGWWSGKVTGTGRSLTADEMREFIENIKDGRNLSSRSNARKIKAFNDEIKRQAAAYNTKYNLKPTPCDPQTVRATGKKYVSNSNRYLAMGVISTIFALFTAKDAVASIADSGHFRSAMDSADKGDLAGVQKALIGNGLDPGGSHLWGDIVNATGMKQYEATAGLKYLEDYFAGLAKKSNTIKSLPK